MTKNESVYFQYECYFYRPKGIFKRKSFVYKYITNFEDYYLFNGNLDLVIEEAIEKYNTNFKKLEEIRNNEEKYIK